jgi:hypothetical protein
MPEVIDTTPTSATTVKPGALALLNGSLETALESLGVKAEGLAVQIIEDLQKKPLTTVVKGVIFSWCVGQIRRNLNRK